MIVSFWSPKEGHGKTTTSMLSLVLSLAIDYQTKILIAGTKVGDKSIDNAFSDLRSEVNTKEEGGLGSISRLVLTGKITPSLIRDNSSFIIKNRLDMLSASQGISIEELTRTLPSILESAEKQYQLVFLDVGGSSDSVTEIALQKSEVIVVCLEQNPNMFDEIKDVSKSFNEKKVIYCVSSFDDKSSFSLNKISSRYGINTKELVSVPRTIGLMDSVINNNIMFYFQKAVKQRKKFLVYNEEVIFIEKLRDFSKKLLEKSNVSLIKEGIG